MSWGGASGGIRPQSQGAREGEGGEGGEGERKREVTPDAGSDYSTVWRGAAVAECLSFG